jgi:hypothetical protein
MIAARIERFSLLAFLDQVVIKALGELTDDLIRLLIIFMALS